jgi:hypothetical protein
MEHIQVTYQPIQDRLVLVIQAQQEEFKIWLTRRFVMLFLAQLQSVTSNDPLVKKQITQDSQKQIMAFQQEQAQSQTKLDTKKTDPALLMEGEPPLLATGIALNEQTLHIQCINNKTLNLKLNTQLAYAMKNLVEAAFKKTGWGFESVRPVEKKAKKEMKLPNYSVRIN